MNISKNRLPLLPAKRSLVATLRKALSIDDCYALISDLYESYIAGEETFRNAIKTWFEKKKIEATPSFIDFMIVVVGYKNNSNKQLYKTGNIIGFKGEKTFMNTLAQLMKDKNALKTDAYKYQFKPIEKDNKKEIYN